MAFEQTTPPSGDVVTLAEARLHMRVTGTEQDTRITSLLAGAVTDVENAIHRQLLTATWKLHIDRWPTEFRLPMGPVASITSIKYVDTAGDQQTVDADVYDEDLVSSPPRVDLAFSQAWPVARVQLNSIVVEYVAGYGAAADVPQPIKDAILSLVALRYENREAAAPVNLSEIPFDVREKLMFYKVFNETVDPIPLDRLR